MGENLKQGCFWEENAMATQTPSWDLKSLNYYKFVIKVNYGSPISLVFTGLKTKFLDPSQS